MINYNTGVPESEQKTQDIRKEDLKRAAMGERRRRENGAQGLRCNREAQEASPRRAQNERA